MASQCFTYILILTVGFLNVMAQNPLEEVSNRVPQFLTRNQTIYARKGEKITLDCVVDKLEPFVNIWSKGKDTLTLGDRVVKSPKSSDFTLNGTSLIIESLDEKREGEYSCVISSSPKQTLIHEVYIKTKPKIVETSPKPTSVTVQEGERVVLNCSATGLPPPTIHWTNEGSSMKSMANDVLGEDETSLTFSKVKIGDAGRYTCVAKNEEGEDKMEFNIKVQKLLSDGTSSRAPADTLPPQGPQMGTESKPSKASSSQLSQREKTVAIMTVVILVAFF